jgi:hypothetical protein
MRRCGLDSLTTGFNAGVRDDGDEPSGSVKAGISWRMKFQRKTLHHGVSELKNCYHPLYSPKY